MSKRAPIKHFTGEFKQQVVEDMRQNNLGYRETVRKYETTAKSSIARWERIYLVGYGVRETSEKVPA